MKHILYFLLIVTALSACQNKKQKEKALQKASKSIDTSNMQLIKIEVENHDFEELGTVLRTSSYVQLAPEPLLSSIKEIRIENERIYVHDATSRIICYDMQGKVIYQIDKKGGGPGEYVGINDFVINTQSKELIIYDNLKLSLLYYGLADGKHLKTESLPKPNPSAIACTEGIYFYNNRYHNNYPNDSALHYSLLVSTNGIDITERYFIHNQAESAYDFSPSPQPFSYNNASIYYCRNFDNRVYRLSGKGLEAMYQIDLPNPLPFSQIENKADPRELMQSNYSVGLEQIYECGTLLHFQFSKDGFFQTALYDLSKKKQIYCGRKMEDKTHRSVPLFRLIDGVYQGRFFGVLTPETIDYAQTKRGDDLPEIFRRYKAESENPIIAFYEIIR